MSYKQYVRELEQQLEAYKYFSDENLEMPKQFCIFVVWHMFIDTLGKIRINHSI